MYLRLASVVELLYCVFDVFILKS